MIIGVSPNHYQSQRLHPRANFTFFKGIFKFGETATAEDMNESEGLASYQRLSSENTVDETQKDVPEPADKNFIHQDDTLLYILIVIAFYAVVLVVLMFKYISAEWKKDHRVHAEGSTHVNHGFVGDKREDSEGIGAIMGGGEERGGGGKEGGVQRGGATTCDSEGASETSSLRLNRSNAEWYNTSDSSICSSSRSSVSLLSRVTDESKGISIESKGGRGGGAGGGGGATRKSPRNHSKKSEISGVRGDNLRLGHNGSNSNNMGSSSSNGVINMGSSSLREPEGYLTSYVMKDGSSSYVVSLEEPTQPSPTKRLNVSKSQQQPVYV